MEVTKGSIYEVNSKKNPWEMRFFITFDDGERKSVKFRGISEDDVRMRKDDAIKKALEDYRTKKGVGSNNQPVTSPVHVNSQPVAPLSPVLTFKEVSDEWFERFKRINASKGNSFSNLDSAVHSLKAVNKVIGALNIREIDTDTAQDMINTISVGEDGEYRSTSFVNKAKIKFKAVMGYALDKGYTDRHIGTLFINKNLKKPDKNELYLDVNTITKLLDAVKGNKTYYTIVNLMLSSGMRPEEMAGLTIDNVRCIDDMYYVHVDQKVVEIEKYKYVIQKGLKNGLESRDIPISKNVYNLVINYYNESIKDTTLMDKRKQNGTEKLIFVNQYGDCHNMRTLERSFGNYLERTMEDYSKINLNMLRHTYGTHMKPKIDLQELSGVMGHMDSKTTERHYVAHMPQELEKVNNAMEELMKEFHE